MSVETSRADVQKLQAQFGKSILKIKEYRGDTFVCITTDSLPGIVQFLKDDPELAYDYFVECLGVDYLKWDGERDLTGRFEVVYNLFATKTASRLFLKVSVDEGETVPTLKHIFLGAEYPERETQDLFGVIFAGNEPIPGERFLLPDDWVGYPLRKDSPLGGEDVQFHEGTEGPAVEDISMPHAGESFEGKTGSEEVSGR